MRAIELGRHLHGEIAATHRRFGGFRIRYRGNEVASKCEEDRDLVLLHRGDRLEGVHSMLAWRRESELRLEGVEEGSLHLLPDAHRAVSLHVAVAADGSCPRPRLTDIAAQEQQVDHLFEGVDRLPLLGHSHGPGNDHPIGRDVAGS